MPDVSSAEGAVDETGVLNVRLTAEGGKDIRHQVMRYCGSNEIDLLEISSTEMSLEDIFLRLTSED